MPHCITSSITQKMRLLFSSVLLAGAFALLNSGTAVAEDWPTWLGPRRDCSSLETLKPWIDAPKVLWKLPIGEGHSSPVIHAGKVYLHSRVKDKDEEVLTCFEASSGKQLWATPYKRAAFTSVFGLGPRATPSISDNCIFTFGVTGILSSFNLADGKINWQVDTLTKFKAANLYFGTSCSPLLVDDKIVVEVGGKGASIVAFNQKDGAIAWQTLDDKSSYSSPTLWKDGDKQMILALTQQGLVALNPKDGKSHWKFPLVDRLNESSTTPVRMGNMVLASSVTYGSVALNLNTLRLLRPSNKLGKTVRLIATLPRLWLWEKIMSTLSRVGCCLLLNQICNVLKSLRARLSGLRRKLGSTMLRWCALLIIRF